MKKIVFYSLSVAGIALFAIVGLFVYGLLFLDDEKTYANVEYDNEYSYNQPPTKEEMTYDPSMTIKGEYGHQTVTHQEGEGIDSVVIDKSEYGNVKEFIDDMNAIFNGDKADEVEWESQFEKDKYFAGSIVVYVNHFVGSVGEEEAAQMIELQNVARTVHDSTNEAEAEQAVNILKEKIAEIYSNM